MVLWRDKNAKELSVNVQPNLLLVALGLVIIILLGSDSQAHANGNRSKPNNPSTVQGWMWLMGDRLGNCHTLMTDENIIGTNKINRTMYPGSRHSAAWWVDHAGVVWMFGGYGYDSTITNEPHALHDLWNFHVLQERWKLIEGLAIPSSNTHTHPHTGTPGPRYAAASCGVHQLAYVIFGGANHLGHIFDDTWVFDITSSTWLPINGNEKPSKRRDMAYWCMRDRIILFGGHGENDMVLNDLWTFSLTLFKWSKLDVKADSPVPIERHGTGFWISHNFLYVYGGQTIQKEEHGYKISLLSDLWELDFREKQWRNLESPTEKLKSGPGARKHCSTWSDSSRNLWLYGGEGCGSAPSTCGTHSILADLWMFNISDSSWIFKGGSKTLTVPPSYGVRGHARVANIPGSRYSSVSWSHQGVHFLFGGLGLDIRNRTAYLNDLWVLGNTNKTYLYTVSKSWLKSLSPGYIFLAVLISLGGVSISFGAIFFLKKVLEYSRERRSGDFRIRYSPLNQQTTLET